MLCDCVDALRALISMFFSVLWVELEFALGYVLQCCQLHSFPFSGCCDAFLEQIFGLN